MSEVRCLTELKCIYQRWISLEMFVVGSCERFVMLEAYHTKSYLFIMDGDMRVLFYTVSLIPR